MQKKEARIVSKKSLSVFAVYILQFWLYFSQLRVYPPQFWLNSQMQVSRNCRNSKKNNFLFKLVFFYKYSNHLTYNLEKSLFIAQEVFNLWTSTWSPVGGKGWQSAYGPEVWEARDRLLAIGSTGTFHSNSGPIAGKMESYPILGAVFKLQRRRMRNRIKQNTPKAKYSKSKILQKREAALHPPAARQSRAYQSPAQRWTCTALAALLPSFIRSRDRFRCDTELLYSRVIWERLVMLAENSHENEVYW